MPCDSKSAIAIVHYQVQHDHTKHIAIDHHFIKEKVGIRAATLLFVGSFDQVTDILTKGILVSSFHKLVLKFGMDELKGDVRHKQFPLSSFVFIHL